MGKPIDERTGRPVLVKRSAEDRNYRFDLRNIIAEGDSLDGITKTAASTNQSLVTSSSNVTLGTTSIVTTGIEFGIAGGTDNEDYEIKVTCSTTDGETLEEYGILRVRD